MHISDVSEKRLRLIIYSFLLITAVCLRWQALGAPMINIDEEFYLFTGGRILQGDLPFVDIWDRKPVGLFLLYAFFHLFGTWRILAYQIGALLSVWGTAILVWRMARTIAPAGGAVLAALLYEIWLILAGGEGGQSPVFYNLLTAAAMSCIICFLPAIKKNDQFRRNMGIVVMLFLGLAIQIKYTVIVEGIFAGLYLLWTGLRAKNSPGHLLADASVWISCALLPTCLSFLFYRAKGYGHAWWFANIKSIFLRGHMSHSQIESITVVIIAILIPLMLCWLIRKPLSIHFQCEQKEHIIFFNIWSVFALLSLFSLGSWYNHYTLPALLPLSIQAAPLWRKKTGQFLIIAVACCGTVIGQRALFRHFQQHANIIAFEEMQAALSSPPGCIFIYDGPAILYDTPAYCKLTTHPFPSHFSSEIEKNATGMNPLKEISSVLAQRPAHIVSTEPADAEENQSVRARLYETLSKDYTPTYQHHFRHHTTVIYTRNTLLSPAHSP